MAILVTLTLPDLETWRAIQVAAAGAALRHARRSRGDTAWRFQASANALLSATVDSIDRELEKGRQA